MAIHYTCRCGANIRMPRNVAGKKARCNSCGFIFTVPLPELNPESESIPLEPGLPERGRAGCTPPEASDERPGVGGPAEIPGAADASGEVGDWLGEFAEHEAAAESVLRVTPDRSANGSARSVTVPATLIGDREDILAPASPNPRRGDLESGSVLADEARSGIIEASRSYWADLAGSFVFFLDAGSFVTFVFIVLANLWTVPLSFAGPIGFAGLCLISGYLCTFYMSVIKETAAGEDELPNVWIDDIWTDLIFSIFRFAGAWAWVLLPAMLFAIFEFLNFGPGLNVSTIFALATGSSTGSGVHWEIVKLLAVIGLFFWPVVILGVSLGGSLHGMWPHTIIMTALVAPLPYLAMCGVLLVAAGITLLPYTETYLTLVDTVATKTNRSFFWTVTVLNSGLSAYAMIVAMRAVGLYYRHYKQKFPWVAE